MTIEESTHQGLAAVVLRDEGLRATVLPTVGAKIISLVDEESGHDVVWQDPYRRLGPLEPGATFADGDISGIDDCFLTVDPCPYPAPPFAPSPIPDHGDVWARDWRWRIDADSVTFDIRGTTLPYLLEKRITLSRRRLTTHYRLRSCTDVALAYQWTAHPLLSIGPDTRIVLEAAPGGRVAFSTGCRLTLDESDWHWPWVPAADGGTVDLSRALPRTARVNEKVWIPAPASGRCALVYPSSGHRLEFAFDSSQLPWLGVCVNYGGWPSEHPGYWIALEPGMSRHDALADSWRAGTARCLRPGGTHTWWGSLRLSAGSRDGRDDDYH